MPEEINTDIVISKISDLQKTLKEYSNYQGQSKKQQIDAIINTLSILIRTLK